MKVLQQMLAAALILATPLTVMAEDDPQWLSGVYVNEDKDALAESLTFCPAGKALYDWVKAAYIVEGKDDKRVVTVYSNGAFTLNVADQGNTLIPANDFTKQWLSKSQLKRDPGQQYECKSGS